MSFTQEVNFGVSETKSSFKSDKSTSEDTLLKK